MAKKSNHSRSSIVGSGWIDVSVPLRNGMVHWPTDIAIQVEHPKSIEQGDAYNLSRIHLGVHSGTHMDAPAHFVENGKTMGQMPLDIAIGQARVIEIQDSKCIKPAEVGETIYSAGNESCSRQKIRYVAGGLTTLSKTLCKSPRRQRNFWQIQVSDLLVLITFL